MEFLLATRGRIQRKTWCMGPFAGVDYNLTLCPLQHMYHGHGHWVTLCRSRLYPPSQGLRIWPRRESDRIQGYVVFVLWRVLFMSRNYLIVVCTENRCAHPTDRL
jgi:hypothetical protein